MKEQLLRTETSEVDFETTGPLRINSFVKRALTLHYFKGRSRPSGSPYCSLCGPYPDTTSNFHYLFLPSSHNIINPPTPFPTTEEYNHISKY